MRELEELEWYRYFVHNKSIHGSLFTLIHLPFMMAFLSLVVIGIIPLQAADNTVLVLSLVVVFLLLYGEHFIDDMFRVGKPWGTVFSDRTLISIAMILFLIAGAIGIYADALLDSALPYLAVLTGVVFCVLYGYEIWKFHTTEFGALGMSAIPMASYTAQVIAAGGSVNLVTAALLGIFGFTYGYVMLALYEETKTFKYKIMWKLLGVHFMMIYGLAGILIFLRSIMSITHT